MSKLNFQGQGFHGGKGRGSDKPAIYLPDLGAFYDNTADIRSTVGHVVQVNGGPSGVNILLTGTFPEGHRGKVNTTDSYTHIAIVDPTVQVRDPYAGQGQAVGNNPDAFLIPAGQTNNKWMVVFSFVTVLPGLGKKKVVFLDRWGTPGSWSTLV
jgi:hypothetical protein